MQRPAAETRLRSREQPTAVVVGAGVSGCACAAVLAGEGVQVTLLNSALDRVNLPGYGPEIAAGPSGWREIAEIMGMLPVALRQAWLSSAVAPESGVPVLIVDRRAVSIETKRTLERMPGLQFRQGLATDLRIEFCHHQDSQGSSDSKEEQPARAAVETVFGEILEADAVIIAVGLGLGGCITVGADSPRGGRYGETPADGLRSALEALGASFGEVALEVGARFPSTVAGLVEFVAEANSGQRTEKMVAVRTFAGGAGICHPGDERPGLEEARRVLAEAFSVGSSTSDIEGMDGSSSRWPRSYPPAVHWSEELPIDQMIVAEGDDGVPVPLVSSDGRATAEIHLSPEGERALHGAAAGILGEPGAGGSEGALASRLEHTVRARVVENLGPDGRLVLESGERPPVWVAGRAAGASTYLGSLRSGALVGAAVARALLKRGGEVRGTSDCPDPEVSDPGERDGDSCRNDGAAEVGAEDVKACCGINSRVDSGSQSKSRYCGGAGASLFGGPPGCCCFPASGRPNAASQPGTQGGIIG